MMQCILRDNSTKCKGTNILSTINQNNFLQYIQHFIATASSYVSIYGYLGQVNKISIPIVKLPGKTCHAINEEY